MGKRLFIQLYKANKGDSITLPINPESLEIIKSKAVNTHNILNYGEVAVAGKQKLDNFTLPGILPADNSYFALLATLIDKTQYKPYTQDRTLQKLDEWILSQEPVRLICSQYINKEYLITQYRQIIYESTADIGYSLDFVEYRNPTKKSEVLLNNKLQIAKLAKRKIEKYIPKQLVGQNGMTLYKLAKLTYGSIAARSNALSNLNAIVNKNKNIAGEIIEMLPIDYKFEKEGL